MSGWSTQRQLKGHKGPYNLESGPPVSHRVLTIVHRKLTVKDRLSAKVKDPVSGCNKGNLTPTWTTVDGGKREGKGEERSWETFDFRQK